MDDSYSVLSSSDASFLLVFLDGLGLGKAKNNPLSTSVAMPFLERYLGKKLLKAPPTQSFARPSYLLLPNLLLKPIDATLGVEGLPQSATGQTTIYTGQNAAEFIGRHQSGFANGSLRQLIDQYGLFTQVMALGKTATLANAYSPEYFYAIARRKRRYSVCTLLNLSAGLPFRMQYEYEQGEAVSWDIIGAARSTRNAMTLEQTGVRMLISPAIAGQRLAKLSRRYDLTLFECYLTDYAGHAQNWDQAVAALQRVDAFLAGAITHRPPNVTLIVTSDHGNVEDLSTKRHTFNQVPLIAIGPHAAAFSQIEDLTGITPQILSLL